MNKHVRSSKHSLGQNILDALKLYWSIGKYLLISYVLLALLQVVASILVIYFSSRIIGELSQAVQGNSISTATIYRLLAFNLLAVFAERFSWRWLSLVERQAWTR